MIFKQLLFGTSYVIKSMTRKLKRSLVIEDIMVICLIADILVLHKRKYFFVIYGIRSIIIVFPVWLDVFAACGTGNINFFLFLYITLTYQLSAYRL